MGDSSSKTITDFSFHFDSLPRPTRRALEYLAKHGDWLEGTRWYLAGGTALTLQVGHRKSVDLDFFTQDKTFDEVGLERILFSSDKWKTTSIHQGTIYGRLAGAKMSLIAYPFFTGFKGLLKHGYVRVMPKREIAVMKLVAVSQRGRKRDFVDLFWYCSNEESLYEIIQRLGARYKGQEDNLHHVLKSLLYFQDADGDEMPKLNFSATWDQMKRFFLTEVPKVTRKLGLIG